MNRRELVLGAALLGAAGAAAAGNDGAPSAGDPHAAHGGTPAHRSLIDAAVACVGAGEACSAHCLKLLGAGDVSMAECATSVAAMLATCRALATLAALESPYLPRHAALCAAVCRDCEKACRKHEQHHSACKACAETCNRCATECDKAAA